MVMSNAKQGERKLGEVQDSGLSREKRWLIDKTSECRSVIRIIRRPKIEAKIVIIMTVPVISMPAIRNEIYASLAMTGGLCRVVGGKGKELDGRRGKRRGSLGDGEGGPGCFSNQFTESAAGPVSWPPSSVLMGDQDLTYGRIVVGPIGLCGPPRLASKCRESRASSPCPWRVKLM